MDPYIFIVFDANDPNAVLYANGGNYELLVADPSHVAWPQPGIHKIIYSFH